MDVLITKYRRLIKSIPIDFKRALYNKINWKSRAILIQGARGTGKSTLMLQHIKKELPLEKTLYISLDDLYFKTHELTELVESFYQNGGRFLYMDEVHKYHNWQIAVKNIYDFYPDLQIVISGSSILALQKSQADLSRRIIVYNLPELSLREYIGLKHSIDFKTYSLKEIFNEHSDIANHVLEKVESPLKVFKEYLNYGAYPFFTEGIDDFQIRMTQLINIIIDYDLPEAKSIEVATQAKIKKLLYVISTSVPFQPNIAKLARILDTSRSRLLEMLYILENAQLTYSLRTSTHGISMMNKPEKLYLHNTNLIHALAEENQNKGNIRETFFLSQLRNADYTVSYPKKGDFLVENKYLFEVGGKNKTYAQVANEKNAMLAIDDLEFTQGNKIPLYLFGFLY